MRRALRPIPTASSALWARRLALAGAVLALGAVGLAQRSLLPAGALLLLLAGGLVFAVLALGAAVLAAIAIWRTGHKGFGRMVAGVAIALLTVAYPGYLSAVLIRDRPPTDLSTDKDHPPALLPPQPADGQFGSDLAWLFGGTPRQPSSGDPEPVLLDAHASEAFRAVLKTAAQLHWRIVAASPPGKRGLSGQAEAATRSLVMRLPERISIRVVETNGQSRVDLRAVSREPYALIGNDLRRNIQAFSDTLENQEPES